MPNYRNNTNIINNNNETTTANNKFSLRNDFVRSCLGVLKFNQALRQVPTLGASARDLHLINTFLGSVEQKNFHN